MKFTRLLLTLTFIIGAYFTSKAQDIHFSMYDMAPLTINPAQTGAFLGTVRLGGIYRSQWGKAVTNGYRTPMFYADSPILPVGKRDWLGVGIMFYQDEAGALDSQTQFFGLSGAYHHVLGKKGNSVVTVGLQFGSLSSGLDPTNANPGNKLGQEFGLDVSSDDEKWNSESEGNNDFNIGLLFRTKLSKTASWEVGGTLAHLNKPEQSVLENSNTDDSKRPSTIRLHSTFTTELSDQLRLRPSVFFQTTTKEIEFAFTAMAGYYLTEEKDFVLNAGLGYRTGDALIARFGVDYKNWIAGASYDITTSELSNSATGNAFELGVSYIIKIFPDPQVDPKVLCPDL